MSMASSDRLKLSKEPSFKHTHCISGIHHTIQKFVAVLCTWYYKVSRGQGPTKIWLGGPQRGVGCEEPDENVRYQFSKNRTKPNWPHNSKNENSCFRSSVFKKLTSAVWVRFSRCIIHGGDSSSNMIGSTVKVFFFMPYLYTSSSESHQLISTGNNNRRSLLAMACETETNKTVTKQ